MKNILLPLLLLSMSLYSQDLSILKFGARPGAGVDNTKAIQKAIDEASKISGTIVFPAGRFETGTIHLKSNITIVLSRNAVWTEVASLDKFERYTASVPSRCDLFAQTNFILAMDAENITIEGEGTIDGNGRRPEIWNIRYESEVGNIRPWGLHFINCRNIKIKGIFLTNSSYWMQRYFNCDNVRIDGIRVFNHGSMNSDGIDIDCCHDVILSNSTFDATDDAICLKSEGLRDCRDVVITNCIARSHASAIKMGTGSMGGFKRIAISNCIISPSKATEMLHTLKCWRGLVGLEILCVDGGVTEDIVVSNLIIDSSETPIHIKLGNRLDRTWVKGKKTQTYNPYDGDQSETKNASQLKSILRNVSLNNIIVKNAGPISSAITGYPGNCVENVTISNLTYEAEGSGQIRDTSMRVEENETAYPVNRMYYSNLPSYGLYARHVKGLFLSNITMAVKGNDARAAVVFDDVHNAKLEILNGENKSTVQPLIKVRNTSALNIIGDAGISTLNKFLLIADDACSGIYLFNTRFPEINHPTALRNLKAAGVCHKISYNKLDWSDGVDNTSRIFEYHILRDNKEIARTRSLQYVDVSINDSKSYSYEVIAFDAEGNELNRIRKDVASVPDVDAPVLQSWRLIDNQTLELFFSEPLDVASVNDLRGLRISPPVQVTGSVISSDQTAITVSLNSRAPAVEYTFDLSGMKDHGNRGTAMIPAHFIYTDMPVAGNWSFDDLTGNVEGITGKGFSPAKSKPIVVKTDAYNNLSGNMAVAVWFKLEDPARDKYYRIISKRKVWTDPSGYELEINPAQGRINICGGATSVNKQGIMKYTFDNQWHHMVAMIKDNKALLYIDGIKVSTDPEVNQPAENSTDLYIGSSPDGTSVFEGTLDELKIYRRALSIDEINALQIKR